MARARRTRQDEIVGPAGPPPPRVPPPWYQDVWPWLLALGIVVLAIIGGYVGYDAWKDDSNDGTRVVTVTTGATDTTTTTGQTETETEVTTTVEEPPPQPVEVPDLVALNHVEAGSSIEGAGLVGDSYPVASTETSRHRRRPEADGRDAAERGRHPANERRAGRGCAQDA